MTQSSPEKKCFNSELVILVLSAHGLQYARGMKFRFVDPHNTPIAVNDLPALIEQYYHDNSFYVELIIVDDNEPSVTVEVR